MRSAHLPLKGGGRIAISAFTRVFDALRRSGWGQIECSATPTPTLPFSGEGVDCERQARCYLSRADSSAALML
jgi:hypothetical protein